MNSNTVKPDIKKSRILVVKLSSLGDIFHALPAVHILKEELSANIDWITQSAYMDAIKCFKDVERVIPFQRYAFFGNLPRFLSQLRFERYDLIIDFQGLWKSAVAAYLARGKKRIGPSFYREGTRILYSAIAGRKNKNRHAVDENLDVARLLNLPVKSVEFPVEFPAYKTDKQRPQIALIPFSRWPSKNWPLGSFLEVGKALSRQIHSSVFLIADAEGASKIAARKPDFPCINLAGKLSLPQLGGLLNEMDIVISNDSGPMHMAAAVGTPVIALFGPTDPLRTGPYGKEHEVIKQNMACQPCFSRKCKFGTQGCLNTITPEQVIQKALSRLSA